MENRPLDFNEYVEKLEVAKKPPRKNPATERPKLESSSMNREKVESILDIIETKQIDLTTTYDEWIRIGFSLSSEFGEEARGLFQQVSKFHPEYSEEKCDKKFSELLNGKTGGITIATFFHYARQAGIRNLSSSSKTESKTESSSNHQLYQNYQVSQLPPILQRIIGLGTEPFEKDLFLLGSMVMLGGCIDNVFGLYDGRKVGPNLFLFVVAPPASGKGVLETCKGLVMPVHQKLRDQSERELEKYELSEKKEKNTPPVARVLLLPANNSSTGFLELLFTNGGKGIMIETEGDTLTNAWKSDYGNYSDSFRKAFHHETISYNRRVNKEYVEIPFPMLSTVLSGTPGQVKRLLGNGEDGLLSRFLFYHTEGHTSFKDVFAMGESDLQESMNEFGLFLVALWDNLLKQERTFSLDDSQQVLFNQFFRDANEKYCLSYGSFTGPIIKRLGLIAFRMMMILTVLRYYEKSKIPALLSCEDIDFEVTLSMISQLIDHSISTFISLNHRQDSISSSGKKSQFWDSLEEEFSRADAIHLGQALGISNPTVDRYLKEFITKDFMIQPQYGMYRKLSQ